MFFFFFQAEDGIRDFHVTGVQTCALPISRGWAWLGRRGEVPHDAPALGAGGSSARDPTRLLYHMAGQSTVGHPHLSPLSTAPSLRQRNVGDRHYYRIRIAELDNHRDLNG